MPLRTPAALKLTPLGKVLVMLNVVAGNPFAIMAKLPDVATINFAAFPLVTAGASLTVKVKFCVALLPTPLLAVKVSA